MRRKDREITEMKEILAILEKCPVMRLAMVDDGRPYIVPLNFGYELTEDGLRLYFHSAMAGRKIDILQKNPQVCFEADCSFNLLTHQLACEWSAEYESVIGEGQVHFLTAPSERELAMNIIMSRYGFPGKPEYSPVTLSHAQLVCLTVTQVTGKRHFAKI